MSVELMHQCKKKLETCITKTEKLLEIFSTNNVEKLLYETCKAESNLKDAREAAQRLNNQYETNTNKLKELIDQGI